jgi:hypothetical protein
MTVLAAMAQECSDRCKLRDEYRSKLRDEYVMTLVCYFCRYRAVAGQCIRSLRIEMHLLVLYHMQDLPLSNYACEEDESKDVDDCVGALSRVLAR